LKILQVVMLLTPRRGGAYTSPYILSQGLIKRGYTVTAPTTDFELDDDCAREIRSKEVLENPVVPSFVTEKEKCRALFAADVFMTPRFCVFPATPLFYHVAAPLRNPEEKEIAEDMKEYCL
jgi:hypothetical protein